MDVPNDINLFIKNILNINIQQFGIRKIGKAKAISFFGSRLLVNHVALLATLGSGFRFHGSKANSQLFMLLGV